jgi:hypothetical protein
MGSFFFRYAELSGLFSETGLKGGVSSEFIKVKHVGTVFERCCKILSLGFLALVDRFLC